jgi:hypothetical protein
MVANEAFTKQLGYRIPVDVHTGLQGVKTKMLADGGDIGKRVDAIEPYSLPLEGHDGSVWSPIIAYCDGNAPLPNLVFMFVGTATNNLGTKAAGDARILMTRLGVRTVVAYNFPIPQNLAPIDMERFVKRASATVWVFDDEQSKVVGIKQKGLSTALWLSDFLDNPEALAPELVRPRGGNK